MKEKDLSRDILHIVGIVSCLKSHRPVARHQVLESQEVIESDSDLCRRVAHKCGMTPEEVKRVFAHSLIRKPKRHYRQR